jgi:hypothetical protein
MLEHQLSKKQMNYINSLENMFYMKSTEYNANKLCNVYLDICEKVDTDEALFWLNRYHFVQMYYRSHKFLMDRI